MYTVSSESDLIEYEDVWGFIFTQLCHKLAASLDLGCVATYTIYNDPSLAASCYEQMFILLYCYFKICHEIHEDIYSTYSYRQTNMQQRYWSKGKVYLQNFYND